ncbi:MAG: hypothetical protein SFX72_03910 [Isosphaeraceae bacterium]|nr:hypothetical protein [Isosphaeraceae bacterium]
MDSSRTRRSVFAGAMLLSVGTAVFAVGRDGEMLRDGFEGPRTAWRQEKTDAVVRLLAHSRTKEAVREGGFSEGFQFKAELGSGFFYSYALPKIEVDSETQVSLAIRSDRSGPQLLARVIFPEDLDPETGQPSFVTIPGTVLESSDRWQRLEILDIALAAERQARLLRVSTKRKVDTRGAYLDRLIVNLYGGPGETTVYLDDLQIGPVLPAVAAEHRRMIENADSPEAKPSEVPRPAEVAEAPRPTVESPIRFDRNGLTRQGLPWVFTAVRAPGADPEQIRRAGFDVLAVSADSDAEELKAATATGLLLMPELDGASSRMLDPTAAVERAKSFPARDAVAFWSLGRRLGLPKDLPSRERERDSVRLAASGLRRMAKEEGGSGWSTGTVFGLLDDYARAPENLNALGVAPFGWGTMQDSQEMLEFLDSRRNLVTPVNPDGLLVAWLRATAPAVYSRAIWGVDRVPSWGVPRVQPEQVRNMVYAAISAGTRAIGFDGDAELTSGAGRAMLIEMALLNEELDLFEWLIGDPSKSIRILPTFNPETLEPPPPQKIGIGVKRSESYKKERGAHPTIRAAALGSKDRRGMLLLVNDYQPGVQFQPSQLAQNNVVIDVPAPADAQAYEFSPGDVRVLDRERVPGGIRVRLEEFGPTALIFVTTDTARVAELQRAVLAVRPLAINLAIEQAQLQLAHTAEIHQMLADLGHDVRDSEDLLSLARAGVKSAIEARNREDYRLAWSEARRSTRPLRFLMRSHFDAAQNAFFGALGDEKLRSGPVTPTGDLTRRARRLSAVSCPPLTSFETLPKFWTWLDWIRRGRLSANLVPTGNFESPEALSSGGWVDESYQTRDIEGLMKITPDGLGRTSRRGCLTMSVGPVDPAGLDRLPAFLDHPAAAIRTPPIRVKAAEIVRVSVSVLMPIQTARGAGGLIVRDSIGGESLQYRTTDAVPEWQDVVFYRRAPSDGEFTVTLGLAGYGTARFDDLQIQKIEALVGRPPETARGPAAPAR